MLAYACACACVCMRMHVLAYPIFAFKIRIKSYEFSYPQGQGNIFSICAKWFLVYIMLTIVSMWDNFRIYLEPMLYFFIEIHIQVHNSTYVSALCHIFCSLPVLSPEKEGHGCRLTASIKFSHFIMNKTLTDTSWGILY